ncbi:MAG TPA: Crp/Fnr family transcriptional regulator [Candidatus Saccharimonadales bacterium]|nr:Crp/Fnr family transcriptional regulator [Candidatus Saccharimonadales bacterium]
MASSTRPPKPIRPPTGPIAELFRSAQRMAFSKGEIILRPDDGPPGIFYIEAGYVKIFSINDRGEEYVHIIYGPGEIFPLIWTMAQQQRSVFYKAITSCTLLHAFGKTFLQDIKQKPEQCFAVLEQVTKQFNIYTHRVDNLEYKYGRERLVYRLLFLASRFGEHQNGSVVLPPITQQDIAGSINLSRESASREIERLERQGLVSYNGRSMILTDVEALSKEIKGVDLARWGLH